MTISTESPGPPPSTAESAVHSSTTLSAVKTSIITSLSLSPSTYVIPTYHPLSSTSEGEVTPSSCSIVTQSPSILGEETVPPAVSLGGKFIIELLTQQLQ